MFVIDWRNLAVLRVSRNLRKMSMSPRTLTGQSSAVGRSSKWRSISHFTSRFNGRHGVINCFRLHCLSSSSGLVNENVESYRLPVASFSSGIELDESLDKTSDMRGKHRTDENNRLSSRGNLSATATSLQSPQDHKVISHDVKTNLLATASEKNDFYGAVKIFEDLVLSGKPLSEDSYLNLARAFMATDDCSELLKFIEEVAELRFQRSNVVINRIILAFSECRQIDKVLKMFYQMKGSKVKPDLITYNTVLDILGRTGHMSEMLQLFASMKEVGMFPDVITYNTLLNGFKKVGRLDMCLVIFKEMGEKGIVPDLFTYTAMIDSFGRSGNVEKALRLFDEMKQRQITPSIYIYRSLINSLKNMRKTELAKKLLEELNSTQPNLACPGDFKRRGK